MPINWSTTAISAAYFGLNLVTKAYFGTTQVYPNINLNCVTCADYLPLNYLNYSAPFNADYIVGRSFDYIDYSVPAEPTFETAVTGFIYPADGTTTGDFIEVASRDTSPDVAFGEECANIILTPAGAALLDLTTVQTGPYSGSVNVDDGRLILVENQLSGIFASGNPAQLPDCFVAEFFRFEYRWQPPTGADTRDSATICRILKINCDPVNNPDGPWSTINVTDAIIDGVLPSGCNGEIPVNETNDGIARAITASYIDQFPKTAPTLAPGGWGYVLASVGDLGGVYPADDIGKWSPTLAEFRANIVPKLLEVYSPTTLYFPNGLEL